jgi:hypothetical protein
MQITQVSKNCIIDTSDNVYDGMNYVTGKIIEEAITKTDPDIIGISSVLDAEDEKKSEGTCNIDHEAASPYIIQTASTTKTIPHRCKRQFRNHSHVGYCNH